jgi:hypothetical protein
MTLSAFDNASHQPRSDHVAKILGRSAPLWNRLRIGVTRDYPAVSEDWGFAGPEYGWSLRLRSKKRVIVHLTPCRQHFLVGLVLGEKATEVARASELGDETHAALANAPRDGQGTGLRLETHNERQLTDIETLIACKMAR